MIEFIVALIVLIVFVVYLMLTFLSYISFFLNLIILIALVFLIKKDLKDKDNQKYYLFSLLLTAIFFIFSTGVTKNLLILMEKMLLSPAIVAVIAVYVFANLIAFIYEYSHHLKRKLKR